MVMRSILDVPELLGLEVEGVTVAFALIIARNPLRPDALLALFNVLLMLLLLLLL